MNEKCDKCGQELPKILQKKECYKNKCDGCECRSCPDFENCESRKCPSCKFRGYTSTITYPYGGATWTTPSISWGYDGRGNNVL
jgi:hypothetical protein